MLAAMQIGLSLGALFLGTLVLGAPVARAWQDAGPDPEKRAAEAIVLLKDAVDAEDAAAIQAALRVLEEVYGSVQPKTVKKIGRAVTQMFKDYVPRIEIDVPVTAPLPGDEPEPVNMDMLRDVVDCYTLAVGVMHDKPEGADVLLPLLKLKHVKEMPRITALVVEGLGYRRDASLTKTLAKFLGHESAEVASAAATALAQLQDHDQADRAVAVEALLEAFEDAETAVAKERRRTKEDDPHPAADHLALLEVPFGEALKSLTRQRFDTPAEWKAWFDAHGREPDW
jgi:hypothetical protein